MEIQLDAPVVSKEGAELGKIDRVLFDPHSGETKSIVIRQNGLFGRSVAAPVEAVRVAAPTRVELDWTKQQADEQPDFIEDDYIWPPDTWVAPYGWPAGSVMWPALAADYPLGFPPVVPVPMSEEAAERLRQHDMDNAVVGKGAEVLAMNGERVGSVDNMVIDPVTHKPSRVILKRGFLFTEDVELPGDWVAGLDDERVTLNVDKVTVEQLAKHQH